MKYFFLILFLLIASPSLAKPASFTEMYSEINSWQAHFVQKTYVPLIDQEMIKTGILSLSKPGKIRIDYLTPLEKHYISNGKKLWIYDPSEKNVEEFSKLKKILSNQAFRLLMMDKDKKLSDEFDIKTLGQDDQLITFEFVPLKEDSIFKKVQLKVNAEDHLIKEMILDNKSGNQTTYQFGKIQTNLSFPANWFELSSLPSF